MSGRRSGLSQRRRTPAAGDACLLALFLLLFLAVVSVGCTVVIRRSPNAPSAQAAEGGEAAHAEVITPTATAVVTPIETEAPTATPGPELTPTRVAAAVSKTPVMAQTPTPEATSTPGITVTPTLAPLVYVVEPGDTVFKIAARYGVSPHILADYNRLVNPSYIQVGQTLLVPQGGPLTAPDAAGDAAAATATPPGATGSATPTPVSPVRQSPAPGPMTSL